MRTAFIKTLVELAAADERVYLLCGDLGFMVLEPFAAAYPNRFINVGVAEQNMVGIATGLAEAGLIPFVYSIATFAALRPYEFIRNGPVGHRLPVRVVGVGGGFDYSHNGMSHFALEDLAVMRTQPALRVVAPADSPQTRNALLQTWNSPQPIYYRLSKNDHPTVAGLDGRFQLDGVDVIGDGVDCLVVSTGAIAVEAAAAIERLTGEGIGCTHAVVASINPAPVEALAELLRRFQSVVTVESHYARGGLFSLVAEVLAEAQISAKIARCAIEVMPDGEVGSLAYMLDKYGLSASHIAEKVRGVGRAREGAMSYTLVSIVIPVHNQADHIGALVQSYVDALGAASASEQWRAQFEIIPVANNCRDNTEEICRQLSQKYPQVRPVSIQKGGWGRAVKLGLVSAKGDLLCFTNSARTTPAILVQALSYAFSNPGIVIKANRKIRESLSRRLGSLLYNLECRMFFDLPTWDINGTPKVFPRSCSRLLNLSSDDDLIDAEFNAVCRTANYPVLEMPVLSTSRHGGRSTTSYKSALKLYWGAFELWRKKPHLAK